MAAADIVDPFVQTSAAATQPAVVDPYSSTPSGGTPAPSAEIIDPFAPGYEAPKNPFLRGLRSSFAGGVAGAQATAALAANAVGATDLGKRELDAANDTQDAAGRDTMRVEDVHDLGSGADFLQYALGYLGSQLAINLGGGAAGRFLGRGVGGVLGGAASKMVGEQAGTLAGLGGSSLVQEIGQIYPDAVQQGVEDPIKRSLVGAGVAAAADILPEAYIAKRLGFLGNRLGGPGALGTALRTSASEGATEAFQTYVERASSGQPTTGPEANSDYLNSVVLGMFGGALLGGATGAAEHGAKSAVGGTDVSTPGAAPDVQAAEAAPPAPPDQASAFATHDATGPGNEPTTTGALTLDDNTPNEPAPVPDTAAGATKTPFSEPAPIVGEQPTAAATPELITPRVEGFQRSATDLIRDRAIAQGAKPIETIEDYTAARQAELDAGPLRPAPPVVGPATNIGGFEVVPHSMDLDMPQPKAAVTSSFIVDPFTPTAQPDAKIELESRAATQPATQFGQNDPVSLAQQGATAAQIDDVLRAQGDRAISHIETMLGTPDHLRITTYLADRGAGGITLSQLKDVISLNLQAKDVLSVANHEGFHYLEHRVLPQRDLDAVKNAFRPGADHFNQLIDKAQAYDRANGTNIEQKVRAVPAEARAYAFEMWSRGEFEPKGVVKRTFGALKRTIERVQNFMSGMGFTSYEDVFRAIQRGHYARKYGSPLSVTNLDVPPAVHLQSQTSVAQMADMAREGGIPRIQLNARIAELLDNSHATGDLKDRFVERTRQEARGAMGSLKRAYMSYVSSGENLARHSAGYKNVFQSLTAYAQRKNRLIADSIEKHLSHWVKGASEQDKVVVSQALLERTVNAYAPGSQGYLAIYQRLTAAQRAMFDQATEMIGGRLEAEFEADKAIYSRALSPDQFAEWAQNRRAQLDRLKEQGYFPERRYGDHVVHAYIESPDGKKLTLYYTQHVREADARVEEGEVRKALAAEPEVKVEYGYRYRAELDGSLSFQQFVDMASRHGISLSQQERERLAKALISADSVRRNRIFQRKNIAGYSEDGMRVLAEFGVTMANKIAYHEIGSAVNDAIAGRPVDIRFDNTGAVSSTTTPNVDLWKGDGEMGGYFRNLSDQTAAFVLSPRETNAASRALRGLASVQFLGGSFAAGMVQLSSMAMNTTPWLTQYTGYTDAFTRSFSGYKTAMANHKALTDLPTLLNEAVHIPGVDEVEGLRHALQIAAQDGTTLDTEIYQIMGLSRGQEYSFSGRVQSAIKVWMTPFRITEQWNRGGTFIASFKLAKELGKSNDDAYKFAQDAVYATQFRYDEANRPALARSNVGSLLFVFKSYPIFMLETMAHLAKVSPKSAVVMMLSLAMMSGVEGLPFAEDIENLLDTLAYRLFNSPFNTKRALRNVLKSGSEALAGTDLSSVMMHGVANELTDLQFASRVGMGNLIPGTRIGAADADYKRVMGEILGPVGTIVTGTLNAADALNKGQFTEAAKQGLPLAGQNFVKGAEQWQHGYATDLGGRKLVDVSGWESFWQAMGFSSSALGKAYDADRIDKQDMAFYKVLQGDFTKNLVKAIRDGDTQGVHDITSAVTAWNQSHPEMPVSISAAGIRRDVIAAGLPINQRTFQTLPKQLRGESEYALGLEHR